MPRTQLACWPRRRGHGCDGHGAATAYVSLHACWFWCCAPGGELHGADRFRCAAQLRGHRASGAVMHQALFKRCGRVGSALMQGQKKTLMWGWWGFNVLGQLCFDLLAWPCFETEPVLLHCIRPAVLLCIGPHLRRCLHGSSSCCCYAWCATRCACTCSPPSTVCSCARDPPGMSGARATSPRIRWCRRCAQELLLCACLRLCVLCACCTCVWLLCVPAA